MNQRIEWIDLLKGIGILFVVAGHSALSPSFVGYIFSFHMPLFSSFPDIFSRQESIRISSPSWAKRLEAFWFPIFLLPWFPWS